ncbi:MAG: ABC transporter permease subunit [Eubacteriales bacterium]|nr:ABC transporter permease subunit [Eubacteriales bacterium]
MRNLISAGFYKIRKSRVFLICMILVNVLSAFLTVQVYQNSLSCDVPYTFEDGIFMTETIMILITAVFVSLFFGTEYSDGTIRNKLIGGYTRGKIYLSQVLVNVVSCLLIYFSSILVSGILGAILMGAEGTSIVKTAVYVLAGAGMCITDAALFTFLTMSTGTKAGASVAGLLLAFCLLCGAMFVQEKLSEKEYMYIPKVLAEKNETAGTAITGEEELVKLPNPYYITGRKRKIFEILLDINPCGQAVQLAALDLPRPAAVMTYDAALTALFCGLGVFVFKKKDLK